MKINYILLVIILFFSNLIWAQDSVVRDFKISISKDYNAVNTDYDEFVSDGVNHVVSVRTNDGKVTIILFDVKELKVLSQKVYFDFLARYQFEGVKKSAVKFLFCMGLPTIVEILTEHA